MKTFNLILIKFLFSIFKTINGVISSAQINLYVTADDLISVQQLVIGKIYPIEQGSSMTSSVTLIQDHGYSMIFDSPSATDLTSKEQMLRGLNDAQTYPGQIQFVVTSHGHPDHFGQTNFFPNSRHFFASYEFTGNNYIKTELYSTDQMKITKNIELWNTPGHTNQDVSAIVRNVPCCGTVGVVGDLFYSEADAIGNTTNEWRIDAWNVELGMIYRAKVICAVDWIIPGHGKAFRVTESMKTSYNCPSSNFATSTTQTFSTTTAPTTVPTTSTPPPTTTTTFPSTTTTTTAPIYPTFIPETNPTPQQFFGFNNDVNDATVEPNRENIDVPLTSSLPAQNYATIDHWQNPSIYDLPTPVTFAPVETMATPTLPVTPKPVVNGLYAVQAGAGVPHLPLTLVAMAPSAEFQETRSNVIHLPVYPIRSPMPPPGTLILPMMESAAANLVSYLNAPQIQQQLQTNPESIPGYFDLIRRAFNKFTKSEPIGAVIRKPKC